MTVKVMIKRHIKEGKAKDVFALLNKHRSNAMNQKGYITGETLMSYQNPHCLLVISTWQSMENWLTWKENKDRKANEAKLEQFLEAPTEYDEYIFGTYPSKK
ncbi:MAG: antibiotic biosynthesis monooxygenase [Desulfobacterales bacterium]|jgi:heme-degrading monooxygenase HmoA